ncbi:hypothetical protein ACIQB5_29720 [Streptomyces sp. NPDC088560]|uniref:effector-associated constant component EACC1 n=1 Tax=Streptomyces sp. NPDC088560 TaxID=3365868 RepID=UPI003818A775
MELRARVARIDPPGDGAGDDGSDTEGWTESFADWITEDRRLSRSATMRRVRVSPGDGGMSPELVSWLSFSVSSGSFLTGLIALFGGFRASLPRQERTPARLVVERDGVRVIIEEGTPEDAARVARALSIASAKQSEGSEGGLGTS